MKKLLQLLSEPLLDKIDVDSDERITTHRMILQRKRMLREVFIEYHHLFQKLNLQFLSGNGQSIELGAGVCPIRETYPEVLASDIVPDAALDLVLDAEHMQLPNNSVRVLYGQNCFHHFPHPDNFFSEAIRVLNPGGGIILIEPYYGPLASFMYKRLFRTEGFDKQFPTWETPSTGPMNGANQALSYLVFKRDRLLFAKKFPPLKIIYENTVSNYLKYLLSGGLNFRQLCPQRLIPVIHFFQKCLYPLNPLLALHHVIVLRKEN